MFNKTNLAKWLPWILLATAFYVYGSIKVGNNHKNKFIWSDAEGYYMYLPAVFIYGFEDYPVRTKGQFKVYPGTNKVFTKYTYGVSVFQAPFFGLAYLSRIVQGKDPTIIESNDYGVTQLLCGCLLAAIGLMFLYRALTELLVPRHVSPLSIKLTIAVLFLGTNLLFYITRAPVMSHVYNFFLVSLIVYFTPRLYEHLSLKYFGLLGILFGMLVLIRPTSIVLLLYPAFYGVTEKNEIIPRLKLLLSNIPKLLLALLFAILVWVPQLAYWKYLSGNWIMYSYKKEGFTHLADPQLFYMLIGPLNGWLTYNPVNILAILGLIPVVKLKKVHGISIVALFLVSAYLFASWWCWWFGGAFGLRSFVDLLPILAIPISFSINYILRAKKFLRIAGISFIAISCIYNLVLTNAYKPYWSEPYVNWDTYLEILKKSFCFS